MNWRLCGLSALMFWSVSAAAVDINNADAATLAKELNGIGMAKAQAIIKDRSDNGPFMSVDSLVRVPGIGPALLERNRAVIELGEQPAQQPVD